VSARVYPIAQLLLCNASSHRKLWDDAAARPPFPNPPIPCPRTPAPAVISLCVRWVDWHDAALMAPKYFCAAEKCKNGIGVSTVWLWPGMSRRVIG
jgi:hypothetical protein